MARIREIAAEIPETEFYAVLDGLAISSLSRVPNFNVLKNLVDAMEKLSKATAA
jgi:formylmethanofuran dehydrogenase subunit B